MKTVELLSEAAPSLEELLELAEQESLLLKPPDGRKYILSEVDDLSQEIEQIRDSPELMEFLARKVQLGTSEAKARFIATPGSGKSNGPR